MTWTSSHLWFTLPDTARAEDNIELADSSAPKVDDKVASDTTTQTDSETVNREAEVPFL